MSAGGDSQIEAKPVLWQTSANYRSFIRSSGNGMPLPSFTPVRHNDKDFSSIVFPAEEKLFASCIFLIVRFQSRAGKFFSPKAANPRIE
jgi:hypothetical protein